MDLMNHHDKEKGSHKFFVIFLSLFLLAGIGIIIFSVMNENEPVVIGENIDVNIYDNNYLKDTENEENNDNLVGNHVIDLKNDYISDSDSKIEANITLPVISIDYNELEELNSEIKTNFTNNYEEFKSTMQDAENNFEYKVTYKYYENSFGDLDVLSVTMYERILDESNSNEVVEEIHAYNINLDTKEVLTQEDLILEILGKDYKDIIKTSINEYVINNGMADTNYHYTYTELEKFYIRDNVFRLLFNPGELVDKSHGIINIKIEVEE